MAPKQPMGVVEKKSYREHLQHKILQVASNKHNKDNQNKDYA